MRSDIADRLLAKVLDWDENDISRYRPEIDILSQIKYDEYQQFFPGLRFTESLATWLYKMDFADRKFFFDFIHKNLIFISSREMNQLVSQAFPDYIRPILYKRSSKIIECSQYQVNRIESSNEYKVLLRKSLFLGLSDGARTDVIRRFNPFISHEQVLPFYLIPNEKFSELTDKLVKELEDYKDEYESIANGKFSNLILLDDFTASGTSYFKFNDDKEEFKGKIYKILNKLSDNSDLGGVFENEEIQVIIIIYIATSKAIRVINDAIRKWKEFNNEKIKIQFETIYELNESINVTNLDTKFCGLLDKYYDKGIETESYLKGKHDHPYLGFDECGLPLILNHNTPNNSLTILWNERQSNNDNILPGLFPRVSRHKK